MVDCRGLAEGKVLHVKSTGIMDYCREKMLQKMKEGNVESKSAVLYCVWEENPLACLLPLSGA